MNSLVSIIVPCYNQAQYLPEALDSILAQTYPHWECIIVNDGSPDNTEEVATQYCEKDKRFKYLFKENGGLSSARNAGIKSSSGEFILPLDADDLIGKDYLEKAIQYFQHFPDTKLVYCKAALFGEQIGEWNLPDYNYNALLFENIIFCSSIFKRIDYNKSSGYNENMIHGLEDWDFWISLLDESDFVYRIPEICFYYRIRNQSMVRRIPEQTMRLLTQQIVMNHKERYEEMLPNIIYMNSQIISQKENIESLESEIKRLRETKAYRLGKFILRPFTRIRSMLRE
ncbi:MAG: glycosyltransferase family 2 protein [Microbacter sp.]